MWIVGGIYGWESNGGYFKFYVSKLRKVVTQ